MKYRSFALMLAILASAFLAAPGAMAATKATPKPRVILTLPKVPLMSWFDVEVNRLGQVVRVKNGKWSNDAAFNHHTYGNVLQMWIRKPNGSATVGMFRVTYNYNPKTHDISRSIKLLYAGGSWGNDRGAANDMMDKAKARAKTPQKLPSFNKIVHPTPHPTKRP